ncbi:peptidylprolyl isomerase [Flavobacterium sp.]|uniref:peptidylprolyl isomerase n=1 Tax=Flavobacterium sp. TaxID=239 RepID=UPI00286D7BCC|nr:peptidylprolyl isomerase [Flavobacterium sp.]
MRTRLNVLFVFLLVMGNSYAQKGKTPIKKGKPNTTKKATPKTVVNGIFAEFDTSKGKIVIELEYAKTPITVANFISLAEGTNTIVKAELKGKPYYNGLKFHRVIKDFMIQGGDPLGNGMGDPGYKFKDEFTDLKHDKAGILSMANSGVATNGSQFFITHKATPHLDGKHTVFGKLVSGMDVVNKIEQNDIINKVVISRQGAAAKAFKATKLFSDYYATKGDDDKKQALLNAERNKAQLEAQAAAKKEYTLKYASVIAEKVASLAKVRATSTKTDSGLEYFITKDTGKKPVDGATIYVHYAGFLEDGTLFDSSYEEVNKTCGKFDQNRANAGGYAPFPFQMGNKAGLIPGFLEGINMLSFGDKATFFIPSKLGYGAQGAGNVIPPNANIIFEVEIFEAFPVKK